ncbi:MAG: hypothetical protein UHD09_06320 [Bifidobacterium sp.]|nr:hypothetical protein [Bifidobacterium sp.]
MEPVKEPTATLQDTVDDTVIEAEEKLMSDQEAKDLIAEVMPPVWEAIDAYNYAVYTQDLGTISRCARDYAQALTDASTQLSETTGWPDDLKDKVADAAQLMDFNSGIMVNVANTESVDNIEMIMRSYDTSDAMRDLREAVGLELPATPPAIEVTDMRTESMDYSDYTKITFTLRNNIPGLVEEVFINYNIKDASGNIVATGQATTNPVHFESGATAPARSTVKSENLKTGYRVVPVEWQILHLSNNNSMDSDQYDSDTVASFEVK